jgi:molecular chaperone GrpE
MKKINDKEEVPVNEEVDTVEENAVDADEVSEVIAELLEDEAHIPEIEVSDAEEEVVDSVEAELAVLKAERDGLKDQALRARAEFDNYRKRMARETDRIRKIAAEGLIRDLLPTLDHLELALSHVEDKSDDFAQGVELIVKQFIDVLSDKGVEPIPAKGEPFDPNVHEALTHQPSDEYPADMVMEEFKRGYRLGDFTLRPSQVVVSSGPAEAAESQEEETEASASDASE